MGEAGKGKVTNRTHRVVVADDAVLPLSKSAFGELLVSELTPAVQIDFPYNINADIINTTLTGSGSASQADSKAVIQTGAATSSSAKISSRRFLKYRPGQGACVRFTALFTDGVNGATQTIGIGDDDDGLFFGYNGSSFGVLRRQNGVDNWVAQSEWNIDSGDGNKTLPVMLWDKGNVFEIIYQWLGFGMITFSVENPSTGLTEIVHNMVYANENTNPSIYNPSLPLMAEVINTTNDTNISIHTSSMAAFVEGRKTSLGPKNSIDNSKAAIDTTLTNIVTIRNKSSFAGKTNRIIVDIDMVTYAVDGAKPAIVKLVKNASLGGSPSYNDISTDSSVIDYDIAGTTVTGGQTLFTFAIGKSEGDNIPLVEFEEDLLPGETLTLAIQATSGTTDGTGSISWAENF